MPKSELPYDFDSVVRNTPFEVLQGPTFVGDFTTALTVNKVISELKILLNHLSEVMEAKKLLGEVKPASGFVIYTGIEGTSRFAESPQQAQETLSTLQNANVVLIVPDGWKKEVEQKYTVVEHDHKPALEVTERQEVIARAMEAGLA